MDNTVYRRINYTLLRVCSGLTNVSLLPRRIEWHIVHFRATRKPNSELASFKVANTRQKESRKVERPKSAMHPRSPPTGTFMWNPSCMITELLRIGGVSRLVPFTTRCEYSKLLATSTLWVPRASLDFLSTIEPILFVTVGRGHRLLIGLQASPPTKHRLAFAISHWAPSIL